jgi:hypothetical protein
MGQGEAPEFRPQYHKKEKKKKKEINATYKTTEIK